MILFITYKKIKLLFTLFLLFLLSLSFYYNINCNDKHIISVDTIPHDLLTNKLKEIFQVRNNAILDKDIDDIKPLYNHNLRNGRWACAHALKKMNYLHVWSEKQGIKFKDINSTIIVRYIKKKDNGFSINFLALFIAVVNFAFITGGYLLGQN